MGPTSTRGRVAPRLKGALALSIGLHGLVVLALVSPGSRARRVRRPAEVRLVVARLEAPTAEVEREPVDVERESPPSAPPPAARTPRSLRASAPRSALTPNVSAPSAAILPATASSDAPSVPSASIAPTSETPAERRRRLRAALIDPARAAALSVLVDDVGPVLPSGPAGLAPVASVEPLSIAEADAIHGEHLGTVAAERPWAVETPIVLSGPHPDGSYTWQGASFTATITSTGSVLFSDRGAVEYDLASGTGTFDLTSAILGAAGADPYGYERERFYEENRELIERLDDAARAADRRHTLVVIERQLVAIWTRTATAAARRAALFSFWNEELSDDEPEGRAAFRAFVARELPEGSEDAFTPSEIAAFDAQRSGDEPFAPYGEVVR